MNLIVSASPIFAAVCYLILAVEYSVLLRTGGVIFLIAFLYSAIWSRFPGLYYTLDFLQSAVWSSAFAVVLTRHPAFAQESVRRYIVWAVPAASIAGAFVSVLTTPRAAPLNFYLYLVCCVGTLLVIEQLIRSNTGLTRIVGISMGGMFLFSLYLYSSALITGEISAELIKTRQLANAAVALLLCFAPLIVTREDTRRRIGLSRPMVFTTTSLVLAGSIFIGIATIGYVLRLSQWQYGTMLQHLFLFVLALLLAFYLSVPSNSARIKVWINKHFFQTKFDYNSEWRLLSERLARPPGDSDYATLAIEAVSQIYDGIGGAFYVKDGSRYVPRQKLHAKTELAPVTLRDAGEFLDRMRSDWIFIPAAGSASTGKYNDLIPAALTAEPDTLLIVPLVSNSDLLAFLTVYGDVTRAVDFDFEDLDLLRMVAKQITSFVGYQMLYEQRLVTLQFETFHQFTTFVMHDLKNLIAQQALVVENAGRFIHNPEFVADAIKTIENSVARMNKLVRKINENAAVDVRGPTQLSRMPVTDVIEEALARCANNKPVPDCHFPPESPWVEADREALVMAFAHLLTNAQDACDKTTGKIDIFVTSDAEQVTCRIADNGMGMDAEFIEKRLFKPFDSTKSTKGMGIGAYQCKQILSKLGGQISVKSKLEEGSCFTITLPLGEKRSAN